MTSLVHRKRPTNSPPFPSPPLNERLTFSKRFGKKKSWGEDRKETESTSFARLFSCKGNKIHSKEAEAKGGGEEEKEQLTRTEKSLKGCRTQTWVQQSLAGQKHGFPVSTSLQNSSVSSSYPFLHLFPFLSLQTDFLGFVWTEMDISWLPGF